MRFEVEAPIAKRELRRRLFAVALLVMALALVLAFEFSRGRLLGLPTLVMGGLAAYAILSPSLRPTKRGSKLHAVVADATGLSVDGRRVLPRAAIASAYCVPAEDQRHVVHVEGRRLQPSFRVYVDRADQGRALIAALGVDPSRSTAHFRALPPWAKHVRWLAVVLTASPWLLVNVIRLLPGFAIGLLVGLYGVILLPTILPQRVDVGHDGLFTRWLGNRRFIPFSKVESASLTRFGVKLVLRSGRSLEIRLTQKHGEADAEARALLARIDDGLAAQRGLSRADEEAYLSRGERDVATWVREMRALGAGEMGGYRASAMPRDRLWDVVENASADRSAREGAALALSASLDDDERDRLLDLAQRTASPRLRVALSGVSRERDETRLRIALETADRDAEPEIDEVGTVGAIDDVTREGAGPRARRSR